MDKFNFYKKKYEAMEAFYKWIDQGIEYNVAAEKAIDCSNFELGGMDDIMLEITIATRYARSGNKRDISETFKKRLERIIPKAKILNLKEYGLTDDEIKVYNEDMMDAEWFTQK